MRPAKEFRAASEVFRRDQESLTFFDPLLIFYVDEQFFSFLTGFIVWLKSCATRLLSGNWQSGPQ